MLIKVAVPTNDFHITGYLLGLPAAAELSFDAMMRLLNSALTCHSINCMCPLLARPMARQLSSDMIQMLRTACLPGSAGYTAQLCQLPEAQSNSTSELVQVLEAAVKSPWCLEELLQLPGAKQLSCDVAAWLLLHVTGDNGGWICAQSVCDAPADQQLSSQEVLQLLRAAVERDNGCALTCICELPAAQQLSSSSMAQLVDLAAEKGYDECFQSLGVWYHSCLQGHVTCPVPTG
jgi:hypothetical protein